MNILQGTLDLLVLGTSLFGSHHGQGIAHAIRRQSEEVLVVDHGPLYPVLQRLENMGWLRAEWGTSENKPQGTLLHAYQGGQKATHRGDQRLAAAGRLLGGFLNLT